MRWIKVSDRLPPYGDDKGEVKVITLDGKEAVRAYEMVSSVTDMLWQEVRLTPTEEELAAAGYRMQVEVSNNGSVWANATLLYIQIDGRFVVVVKSGNVEEVRFCRKIRKKPEDCKVGLVLNSHSGDYIDMAGVELPKEVEVRFIPRHRRRSVPRFGESYDEMMIRKAGEAGRKAAAEAIAIFEKRMKEWRTEYDAKQDVWVGEDCEIAIGWLTSNKFYLNGGVYMRQSEGCPMFRCHKGVWQFTHKGMLVWSPVKTTSEACNYINLLLAA